MASLNRWFGIGNLTRDCDLSFAKSGTAICKFGLAVNEKRKKEGEYTDSVTFVDITVFGKQAENCAEYLTRGRAVFIEGRLQFSQWETDDKQKRSKLEVVANTVQFLGSGQKSESSEDSGDVPF